MTNISMHTAEFYSFVVFPLVLDIKEMVSGYYYILISHSFFFFIFIVYNMKEQMI